MIGVAVDVTQRKQNEDAIRTLNTELEQKASQLATLNEMARAVTALTDLPTTLKRVLAQLQAILPLDVFYVAFLDPLTRELTFPIMYDMQQFWNQPARIVTSSPWIDTVITTGNPILINRTPEEMAERSQQSQNTLIGDVKRVSASIMMAPLSLGETHIGVISVQSYTLNSYHIGHIDLLMGAAYQIAIAVENARLYDSLREELFMRQAAESQLLRLNEELEQRVQQRTIQLEITNKELEAFAYSVSHDLRAPLRSVDGFSQALLEDYETILDENGQGYLRRVRASAQRMGAMIDALLILSRITRAALNLQTVNLSSLAEEHLSRLREEHPTRDVQAVIMPDVVGICDPRLIQIALENLIANAWKYTQRQAQTRIEFGHQVMNGETIYFVADNGVGFDMAHVERIFGVFQRLHTDQEFEGTGIGLATVQRVIHRHVGRIWAQAALGAGATFYFTLMQGQRDEG